MVCRDGGERCRIGVVALTVVSLLLWSQAGWAATYKVDPDHSSVSFRVRHLFSWVQGRFDRFEGRIVYDPEHPEKTKVEGSIDVASINTNVANRDKDLRSNRFFEVEKFPKITFVTTGVSDVDAAKKSAKLQGKLTMHGVERPVVLDVSYLGEGKDPWGNTRAGFSAKLTLNRKDFGLTWNKVLETGGVLVGEEVQIEIDAEGMRQD